MTADRKAVTAGTHRACPPEETWIRIAPLLRGLGITRVAEITWLDGIGVPVFQAVQPRSRSLATAQGKGVTRALARVSAAMEAIETYAAEAPPVSRHGRTAGELGVAYDVGLLAQAGSAPPAQAGYARLARTARYDWCSAVDLQTGSPSYVPAAVVSLDWTVRTRWEPVVFVSSSDGLASGNTYAEAVLHGLLELLERAALSLPARIDVDPASVVGGESGRLVRRIERAGMTVRIAHHPGALGLPVFSVTLRDAGYPMPFAGSGCHLDADVALSRALTEAAQSRATCIAGSRDDLPARWYRDRHHAPPRRAEPTARFADVARAGPVPPSPSIAADLEALLRLLRADHPHVLAVDLSLAQGVHVAKVVVPTLPVLEGH